MSIEPLFPGLDTLQIENLIQKSEPEIVPRHKYLFREGEKSDAVFVIEKGELLIERTTRNGDRQVTTLLFPGHFVGFTNGSQYDYGVFTVTDCNVRKIARSLVESIASQSPDFSEHRIRELGALMLEQSDHLFTLAKKQAHERVCCFLCELNDKQRKGQGRTVNIHLSRQDIADYLGLTSETVTRALSKLKSDAVIGIDNPHEIELLQPDVIQQLAGKI